MTRPDSLEQFSAGEAFAVHPDTIERELSRLWQEAGRSTGDLQPVTRACLWNAVFVLEERPGHEGASAQAALERAVDALPTRLANRSLVLRTKPRGQPAESLSSFISANCVLADGGGKRVCSEEVTLVADEDGLDHLPGLVRALLVPGVPTAVIFGGLPAADSPVQAELVKLADRVVTALDWSERPDKLRAAKALFESRPLYGMDLGWVRGSELRDEIAHRFEPPTGLDAKAVVGIIVHHAPEEGGSAKMVAGWIAHALGARSASKSSEGDHQARLKDGRTLRIGIEAKVSADDGMKVVFVLQSGSSVGVDISPSDAPLDAHLGVALTARRLDRTLGDALTIGAHL